VLRLLRIDFCPDARLRQLRGVLKKFIRTQKKGKQAVCHRDEEAEHQQREQQRRAREWPRILPSSTKAEIVSAFRNETGTAALSLFTCASCAESCLREHWNLMPAADVPTALLQVNNLHTDTELLSCADE